MTDYNQTFKIIFKVIFDNSVVFKKYHKLLVKFKYCPKSWLILFPNKKFIDFFDTKTNN